MRHRKVPSEYTKTGARRAGDDYQDVVALEVLIEILEHPNRYQWVRVEADDAGFLDDVVALRTDGSFIVKQVKFSTHPESETDVWTWEKLLEKKKGKSGKLLQSFLEKWASSLKLLRSQGSIHEASVVSNRRAAREIQITLSPDGLVDFDKIDNPAIRDKIIQQLGDEVGVRNFFAEFHFYLDRPNIENLEQSLRRRCDSLGIKEKGWLNLKNELRSWVRLRNQPPPDGAITLAAVRSAVLWYQLQSLPQQFEIPKDYVLPSQDFHTKLVRDLIVLQKGCVVLTGSPGVGKSTYLSYLFGQLGEEKIPVIRHHYFLSLSDRTVGRLDHKRVAESLMNDIQRSFPEALGDLAKKNPKPAQLYKWIDACGQYFAQQKKALVIIIDGLDYVWREKRSMQEVDKLFEHLLPAPDRIVILLGTQPLDEREVPLRLKRAAPPDQWRKLPLLDRDTVGRWIRHHENELDLPKEQQARDVVLEQLANAFFDKSQGHPLHLRYTLKALQEQNRAVTPRNIASLPDCPHQEITEYYEELWHRLPEKGVAILHLFAACRFPWPQNGIVECLEQETQTLDQIYNALRQVKHLLLQDALGLRPFHSSLLEFIADQPDHKVYSHRMKRLALDWLRTGAPEYWRWAYEWLLEMELGNDDPLIKGPSRAWAVEVIAKRYPRRDASEILAYSSWLALQHKDLPRFIEVGLLRDYFNIAYEFRSEQLGTLLYPQLIIEEDPHLRARLYAKIRNLTGTELVLLSESEASRGNRLRVHECFCELNERLKTPRTARKVAGLDNWSSRVLPMLKVAALDNDIDPARVVNFAIRNREHGRSYNVLATYTEALRAHNIVPPFRQMLKMEIPNPEHSVVFRHAVFLALEKGLDLTTEVSVSKNSSDPLAAIYAALCKVTTFKLGNIQFPSTELLALRESEQYFRRVDIEELFYATFFCFLANHLWQQGVRNEEWLQKITSYSWPRSFLYRLNAIASDLAQLLLTNSPNSFGWFYDQLKSLRRPSFPEDRQVYQYGQYAEQATNRIALDIMILYMALGKTSEITKDDLEVAFAADYCHPWIWMDAYVARRRKWLSEKALKWLLQEQAARLASSIEPFSERASHFSALASLAALHGLRKEASHYVREAALNLISYGDHKDILLFGALEVVQACHRVNLTEARQWLLRLVPAIANVGDFTDGDETRHLPRELGDVLAEVAIDLLPAYYQWLCMKEEYDDALNAFHSFLRTSDLSVEINQALAKTAIDEESLVILAERTEKGDQGAKTVLSSLTELLGVNAVDKAKSKKSKKELTTDYKSYEESLPLPCDFPPNRFIDYLSAVETTCFHRREECIVEWIKFWTNAGRQEELYSTIKKEADRGVEVSGYDALFDLAFSLYGKDEAYPWLVKAHTRRYGWNRYYAYKEEALRRWEAIKEHYPEKWFNFIRDTIEYEFGEPWRWPTVYNWFVRLIEYCLFIGQTDLAKQASEQVITSTMELLLPLMLPTPEWVKDS